MAAPNHCYSNSTGFHQNHKAIPFNGISWKRFGSKRVSLQSNHNHSSNVIQMQDGALPNKTAAIESENPSMKLKKVLSTDNVTKKHSMPIVSGVNEGKSTVSITVVGASGDLAKKKIFPALFALYYEDCLPEHFTIFGYARSKMTDAELRTMVSKTLTCRIDKRENCGEKMEQFLEKCFYHSGQYDSQENFEELDIKLKKLEVI